MQVGFESSLVVLVGVADIIAHLVFLATNLAYLAHFDLLYSVDQFQTRKYLQIAIFSLIIVLGLCIQKTLSSHVINEKRVSISREGNSLPSTTIS